MSRWKGSTLMINRSSHDALSRLAAEIAEAYERPGAASQIKDGPFPSWGRVIDTLQYLLALLFPGYPGREAFDPQALSFSVQDLVHSACLNLQEEIARSLRCQSDSALDRRMSTGAAEELALALLKKIPDLRECLWMDVQAAYDGDPAARSHEEIVLSYPGILAVATYRLAHELYRMEVPLIPRIMTEWTHSRTGIDIHPGAAIGSRFFIDHGTGVVIGETTEIGDDVKIYQGVTLGALSFPKSTDGRVVKGGRRHPTIEDGVTIYAGASIFGGSTVIGQGSVVGANASIIPRSWKDPLVIGQASVIGPNATVTESVPPATRVTIRVDQEFTERRSRNGDLTLHRKMAVLTARDSSI